MPRRHTEGFTGQLKKVAGLQQRRQRERFGQMIVEGPQAVRELLAQPEFVRDLYVTEAGLSQHPDLDALAQRVDPYTHILSEDVFGRLSTSAQGWLAVAEAPLQPSLEEFFAASPRLVVCLVESGDPGNLGTIIRSADAAGADGVVLCKGSVELFNPKVIRSSVGSVFHLPILSDVTVDDAVAAAHAHGLTVLCADGSARVDLLAAPSEAGANLADPTMWLVGNEAHGFTPQQLALADLAVRIPMWGQAESLNAAVAASLCLYSSALAQRR
ncbi:TrmH family RNA methyltransferase [Trueperella pecoris]|nr:RNA methyltransferase [Trueperella pecoris]